LLALALKLAKPELPVILICEERGAFTSWHQSPDRWRTIIVDPGEAATSECRWRKKLMSAEVPKEAILVIDDLNELNSASVLEASMGRWLLTQMDTPLVATDVAYPLAGIGITHDDFLTHFRLVWSQQLIGLLCTKCSAPTKLTTPEMDDLFPIGLPGDNIRREVGCARCDATNSSHGKGNEGIVAIADVLLIDDASRKLCRQAVEDGTPLSVGPTSHITAQDQARSLAGQGLVGINTFRDAILRNPLLRAQNQLERERSTSFRLGNLFDKFVSPEIKDRLLDREALQSVINGESLQISCLFCDIRNFTARAESRNPEELFAELNRYFAQVVDAVLAHDGTIDKFIGDAVMVVFGAPMAQSDHAQRAVACALSIRKSVAQYNVDHGSDMPITVGIGVNSGNAIAGCIGTDRRMEYTVLGDTVNIAARLESRAAPGQILISGATRGSLNERFELRSVGSLELKGKVVRVDAFEVI